MPGVWWCAWAVHGGAMVVVMRVRGAVCGLGERGGRGEWLRGGGALRVWSCGVRERCVWRAAWEGSSTPGQGQRGVAEGSILGTACMHVVRCGARALILFGLVSAGGLAGFVCSISV